MNPVILTLYWQNYWIDSIYIYVFTNLTVSQKVYTMWNLTICVR